MSARRPRRPRAASLARGLLLALVALAAAPAGALAAECEDPPSTKVFAPWGDLNDYYLAPGGDFEGSLAWRGSGPVGRQDALHAWWAITGRNALRVGANGVATSPAICVSPRHPHARFFLRGLTTTGTLTVTALDLDAGTQTRLTSLNAAQHPTWAPSGDVPLAKALSIQADSTRRIALRFSATGGTWLIDGVFVDPYAKR